MPRKQETRTRASHEDLHDLDRHERNHQHHDHQQHATCKIRGIVLLASLEAQGAQGHADDPSYDHANGFRKFLTDHPAEALEHRENRPRNQGAEENRERHAHDGACHAQHLGLLACKRALGKHSQQKAAGIGHRKESQGRDEDDERVTRRIDSLGDLIVCERSNGQQHRKHRSEHPHTAHQNGSLFLVQS